MNTPNAAHRLARAGRPFAVALLWFFMWALPTSLSAQNSERAYKVSGKVSYGDLSRKKGKEAAESVLLVAYTVKRDSAGKVQKLTLEGQHFTQWTDAKGKFELTLYSDREYALHCIKEGFYMHPLPFGIRNLAKGEGITLDITLERAQNAFLEGLCLDQARREPIPEATVTLTSLKQGTVYEVLTDNQGRFRFSLNPDESYLLLAQKKKYFRQAADTLNPQKPSADFGRSVIWMKEIALGQTFTLDAFFYELNDTTLTENGKTVLDQYLPLILENPSIQFELSCHSDSRGNDDYNLKLTQSRADVSARYLIEQGVPRHQIVSKGYGEQKLLNHCSNGVRCTNEEHLKNRRIEIKVLGIVE